VYVYLILFDHVWINKQNKQADHNFSWTKPGHQIFTLKVHISALKSKMTLCKMLPINLFRFFELLFENLWSPSPVADPGSEDHAWEGFRKGTHPRRRDRSDLRVGIPHICLRKLRSDSILSEKHSKINETLETTFACCRYKCNVLHEYGEKYRRPVVVVLTVTNIHSLHTSLHFCSKFICKIQSALLFVII